MKILLSRNGLRLAKIWVDELSEVDAETLDQITTMRLPLTCSSTSL